MTTKKNALPAEKAEVIGSPEFPRSVQIPPLEEIDTVDALLRRMCDQTSGRASSSFAYQDLEDYDHIGTEALHRVVEELQFGHDLRL